MHELTLLFGIADKVGKVVKENGLERVDAVVVEVGDLTSVVPEYLLDGYSVVSDDYDFLRGSKLIVERVKGMGLCRECGAVFPIVENKGYCPECGSFDKEALSGQDFIIKEVRVYEGPPEKQEG